MVSYSQYIEDIMKLGKIKTALFLLSFLVFGCYETNAQARVAFVDSEYILESMPEYRSAVKQLEDITNKWKLEIIEKKKLIDKQKAEFEVEFLLLPEAKKSEIQEEILSKEKDLEKFKQDKFGQGGELFLKRQQLIKPVQDKVFDAIQKLAKEASLDIILDKSGGVTLLYTNSKYDRSDDVLEILGVTLSPQENKK